MHVKFSLINGPFGHRHIHNKLRDLRIYSILGYGKLIELFSYEKEEKNVINSEI